MDTIYKAISAIAGIGILLIILILVSISIDSEAFSGELYAVRCFLDGGKTEVRKDVPGFVGVTVYTCSSYKRS